MLTSIVTIAVVIVFLIWSAKIIFKSSSDIPTKTETEALASERAKLNIVYSSGEGRELQEKIKQAVEILDEIIEELPQTVGGVNIPLLCRDLKQARKYLD